MLEAEVPAGFARRRDPLRGLEGGEGPDQSAEETPFDAAGVGRLSPEGMVDVLAQVDGQRRDTISRRIFLIHTIDGRDPTRARQGPRVPGGQALRPRIRQ